MATIISVRIDVNKIDKTKFYQGAKGKYLNIVLIETPKSKFGDYMVKQEQSKEDRLAKVQTPILGNAKILDTKGNGGSSPAAPAEGGGDDGW